jgi:RHS repeat-associated protein
MAKVNPFWFSTKYQDDETDLLYYGYRYYSPSTGRWISRDPRQDASLFNEYCFVNNAPTRCLDDLGRSTIYIPITTINSPPVIVGPPLPPPPSLPPTIGPVPGDGDTTVSPPDGPQGHACGDPEDQTFSGDYALIVKNPDSVTTIGGVAPPDQFQQVSVDVKYTTHCDKGGGGATITGVSVSYPDGSTTKGLTFNFGAGSITVQSGVRGVLGNQKSGFCPKGLTGQTLTQPLTIQIYSFAGVQPQPGVPGAGGITVTVPIHWGWETVWGARDVTLKAYCCCCQTRK